MPFLRFLFFFFLVSVALNFGWEISQMSLYSFSGVSFSGYDAFVKAHWISAVKDALMCAGLYVLVAIFTRNAGWGKRFTNQRLVFLESFGFMWAVAVEYQGVMVRHAWAYAKAMPLLPGLNVGIVPVLQMMVVPLVGILLVRKQLSDK